MRLFLFSFLMFFHAPLFAAVTTYTFTTFGANPDLAIPDGNAAGVSDNRTVASADTMIQSVQVMLDISAEFNGDLYVYLQHDTGLSVLLNRTGKTTGSTRGYSDSGFNVTLSGSAANGDIHTYRNVTTPVAGSPLIGFWQPDGRTADPGSVLDTDPRTAFLSSFDGLNPNGTWTLFAADMGTGGTSTIGSWGMEITAVPEPADYGLAVGIGLVVIALWRSRWRRMVAAQNKMKDAL